MRLYTCDMISASRITVSTRWPLHSDKAEDRIPKESSPVSTRPAEGADFGDCETTGRQIESRFGCARASVTRLRDAAPSGHRSNVFGKNGRPNSQRSTDEAAAGPRKRVDEVTIHARLCGFWPRVRRCAKYPILAGQYAAGMPVSGKDGV
jgi:hypothetical protein